MKKLPVWLRVLLAVVAVALLGICGLLAYFLHFSSADCIWAARAGAWLDLNGDGLWGSSEQPISGIRMQVDDRRNNYVDVGNSDAVTDTAGWTQLVVWLPGCPKVDLEVYPAISEEYRLTTPARIHVRKSWLGDLETDAIYSFGLVPNE